MRLLFKAAVLALLTPVVRGETVIYVDDDAMAGGDGVSWEAAYRFLQDALHHARDPANAVCEIRLAGGLYRPDRDEASPLGTGVRSVAFELVDGVAIIGGYQGLAGTSPDDRDVTAYETMLSGDLLGNDGPGFRNNTENSYHVVTSHGIAAELSGLTIRGGLADGAGPDGQGGGLLIDGSSLAIVECTFQGNATGGTFAHGAGVYNAAGDVLVIRCRFVGNAAEGDGAGVFNTPTATMRLRGCVFESNTAGARGGGIRNNAASPSIIECEFIGNKAVEGAGIHNSGPSHATLRRCEFSGNIADSRGGAIYNVAAASPTVIDCTFQNNTAGVEGGAIRNLSFSDPLLRDCTFTANRADKGGAIFNWTSSPDLIGCTFRSNTATLGGGLYNFDESNPAVTDCVFGGNVAVGADRGQGGGVNNALSHPVISGCLFVANRATDGGAVANDEVSRPQIRSSTFVANSADAMGGGIFCRAGSEPLVADCTLAGNTAGRGGGGAGSVLFGRPAFSGSTVCENLPNQIEGSWDDNGGNTIADTCLETCYGDLSADRLVGINDLMIVLFSWGTCPSNCVADLDDDGLVGITDFFKLMSVWGPCPQPARRLPGDDASPAGTVSAREHRRGRQAPTPPRRSPRRRQ